VMALTLLAYVLYARWFGRSAQTSQP
jgi:hypothetical protein